MACVCCSPRCSLFPPLFLFLLLLSLFKRHNLLCNTHALSCSLHTHLQLEHVSEKFAGLWTDLEQEKQVGCWLLLLRGRGANGSGGLARTQAQISNRSLPACLRTHTLHAAVRPSGSDDGASVMGAALFCVREEEFHPCCYAHNLPSRKHTHSLHRPAASPRPRAGSCSKSPCCAWRRAWRWVRASGRAGRVQANVPYIPCNCTH